MIINGGSRTNGSYFARHLMSGEKNEQVTVVEFRGLGSENLRDALHEMEGFAAGTRAKNYFYHANINPLEHEHLTPEQWRQAVDTLEKNLGLTGQPRFVVEHEKEGRTHRHVIWSRIDLEKGRTIPDAMNYAAHERTSRELETAFGLQQGESVLTANREGKRPQRTPEFWAMQKGKENGIDPRDVATELTALWQQMDSGQAFRAAIEERGYILARGDRRDFVIFDQAANDHSLARRLHGVNAAQMRERMSDIDRAALPSFQEAKAMQLARIAERQREQQEGSQGMAAGTALPDIQYAAVVDRAETAAHGMERAATKSFSAMVAGGEKLIDLVSGAADFFFATPRRVTPEEAAVSREAMVEYMQAAAFEDRRAAAYERMVEERAAGKHLTRDAVRYLSETDRANYRAHGDAALDQMFRDHEIEEERRRVRRREL